VWRSAAPKEVLDHVARAGPGERLAVVGRRHLGVAPERAAGELVLVAEGGDIHGGREVRHRGAVEALAPEHDHRPVQRLVGVELPGPTRRPAGGIDVDTARETIIAGIGGFATGRFATPQEVAKLITLLASDATANVTGADYVIDGGLVKTT
jgi:hypothetical protein